MTWDVIYKLKAVVFKSFWCIFPKFEA